MPKQWKIIGVVLAGLLLISLNLIAGRSAAIQAQGGGPTSIDCSTFSSGQANGANNGKVLVGTLGQWVVGNDTNGTSQLSSGFGAAVLEACRGAQPVFLPALFKSPPAPQLTRLLLKSTNTGGINPLEIRDPDNSNQLLLTCIIAPSEDNTTKDCGYFTAVGRYTLIAHTTRCGVKEGTFTDALPGATVTREVFCN
jgi:hypothetical protein